MKRIPLTKGKFALVDDEDFDQLYLYRWHASRRANGYYADRGSPNGKRGGGPRVLMHREILQPQPWFEVDHVDGDGLNNQRANLRLCTHSENMCNRRAPNRNNLCGIRGIRWRGPTKGWQARLMRHGKESNLGHFDTARQALEAVKVAATSLHMDFAGLFEVPANVDLDVLPRRDRTPKNNTGFKGVYFDPRGKKHYRAMIEIDGGRIELGRFETPQAASAACELARTKARANLKT